MGRSGDIFQIGRFDYVANFVINLPKNTWIDITKSGFYEVTMDSSLANSPVEYGLLINDEHHRMFFNAGYHRVAGSYLIFIKAGEKIRYNTTSDSVASGSAILIDESTCLWGIVGKYNYPE